MLSKSPLIGFAATKDPVKAQAFYEGVLQLKLVSSDLFALVFDAGGITLRIQVVTEVLPHPYTALGWQVADIRKEVAELSRRGVTFARYEGMGQDGLGIWSAPGGAKVAWFADPDGNILSLTEF